MVKSTIDSTRFKPVRNKERQYVEVASGKLISRRQATQLSIGGTLEKRAKQNKLQAPAPTFPTKLPRSSKLKTVNGNDSGYRQIKAKTLAEVSQYAALMPSGTVIQVKARGYPNVQSPKMRLTKPDKNGYRRVVADNRKSMVWSTISKGLIPADEVNMHLVSMSETASSFFSDMRELVIMYRPGK
jgi:hypothetical protein